MKKLIFIGCLFILKTATAQFANTPVKLVQYVLDSFSTGTVKVKSGKFYQQRLNYNILSGEMIFEEKGKLLAIADPREVDTIIIQDRKFIPLNNKFYEVLTNGQTPLLLEFTYQVEEPGNSVGYGGSSNTSSATSLQSFIKTGNVNDLKLPDDFKVTPGFTYWIIKDGNWMKAGTAQQLSKIYPEKKELIKELVKKNKTNFSKRDEIVSLVKQVE
ncbi:MAG: hypothetical protein ABIQ31_16645 [Ferruginibacter sp.]